ncbi:MAG TPA: DMT family transporter, partial [Rhodanobacter sp.]|nr:DMT family transporter [Rhodanobacter sp.]
MSESRRVAALATLGLVVMTAVWGSTFVLIKDVVSRMPVADFLAVRFAIAALAMLILFWRQAWRLGRAQILRGLLLGAIYGIGQLLQTRGLALISPSVSGFATGMYVVFTPILALVLLRQQVAGIVWLAVALATAGLALLTLDGFEVGLGVWLTLASAVCYALHIILLGQWSRRGEAFGLSAVQMVAIALVCLLATTPHGPTLPPDPGAWFA